METAQSGDGKGMKSLRVERRSDGVAVVWFDVPGEEMNTLKSSFAEEFGEVFGELQGDSSVRAIVFTSAKEGSFLAGADVSMLQQCSTAGEAEDLARQGQDAMNRIATLGKPIVAAIHGSCLGGGLELAMACSARVATDDDKTRLGQPEVQLGLLPGAGGTQRLPRLIGVQQALDLMLTGKQIPAKKARKMGLVDEVVRRSILVDVAVERALALADNPPASESTLDRLKGLFEGNELKELAMAENPLGRKVVFDQARKQVMGKTQGNYPAPLRILSVVRTGLEKGFDKGLEAEAQAFGELVVSPEGQELMGIFFATQSLKKDNGVDDPSVEPRKVQRVGMLGAGLMGAGIAYVTADKAGIPVRLKDKDDDGIDHGLRSIREIVDERVQKKRMSKIQADQLMYEVQGTTEYTGFERCDVAIEAVFEDLSLKQRILRETEQAGPKDIIFASNTSSIPIHRIAEASQHPGTVIGMHYFSPVHKMPLLEIIKTDRTADWVTATCVQLGKDQGKTVIVVRDGTGFYTTRILAPFMGEAFHILAEGVPVERIDGALTNFGFPVGPVKLTDEVGIDVGAKVTGIMKDAFGERMTPPPGMEKLMQDERYGRKNGRGFYRYDGKKGVDESVYKVLGVEPRNKELPEEDIAWRCTLQMVNEAARCFGEGILRGARDGDIGAVFGLGFPPFRGGPFRFVDRVGPQEIVRRLRQYEQHHGVRFEPAPVLVDMAERNLRFHAEGGPRPGQSPGATETRAAARA
jgi:3-hydroxyacyl-CoA dehydrogenase/enoyl-CoA hydratase/3-hydroxybutyryl-CoA epimerase